MIDILLATHNSEKYIKEQIESIIDQTFHEWQLIIRDDGSTDKTPTIIQNFSNKYPNIQIIKDSLGNIGLAKNFGRLLKKSQSSYSIFCDHDDVWHREKLSVLMNRINALEKKYGYDTPLLVHCDSIIVNEQLEPQGSFIGPRGEKRGIENLIFSPSVQGANMLINKSLRDAVLPFPDKISLHDYYISILNELIGHREYVKQPLMFYRQHSENVLGKPQNFLVRILRPQISYEDMVTVEWIYKNKSDLLGPSEKKKLADIVSLNSKESLFKKLFIVIKSGFKARFGALHLIIKVVYTHFHNKDLGNG